MADLPIFTQVSSAPCVTEREFKTHSVLDAEHFVSVTGRVNAYLTEIQDMHGLPFTYTQDKWP